MTRFACFILLVTSVFYFNGAALCRYRTKAEAGVANVVLFYYDPRLRNFSACRSLSDALLPYVGYVDKSGKVVDRFFDGVLLIDTSPFFGNPHAATKEKWETYLEATFKARQLDGIPRFSSPGYTSRRCVQIPYENGCVYQDSIYPRDSVLILKVHARVDTVNDEPDDGYVGVVAFDSSGCKLKEGLSGLTYSTYLGLWYRYVDADTSWQERRYQFQLARNVSHLSIFLGSWHTRGICYDNIGLEGGRLLDGEFERVTPAWKSRDFPNTPFGRDTSAMLTALSQAVGALAGQLKEPGIRESVILMIPWDYRSHLQTDFGRIDGKKCDLSEFSDATRAVMWFIKRCVDEWNELQPERLELLGFYWLNEAGNDFRRVDFAEIFDYVHKLGYRLYASPYHSFWHEPSKGEEYVPYFDCLWLQPNAWPPDPKGRKSKGYYSAVKTAYRQGWLSADSAWVRNQGIPMDELKEAETIAESLNMGINMEWTRGQESVKGYGRILDYIDEEDSLPHDFTEAGHLFFDAGGFGWYCCYSDTEAFREQYDAVYRFVKKSR